MPRPKHTVAYRERMQRKRRRQRMLGYTRRWNVFHGRQPNDCYVNYTVTVRKA